MAPGGRREALSAPRCFRHGDLLWWYTVCPDCGWQSETRDEPDLVHIAFVCHKCLNDAVPVEVRPPRDPAEVVDPTLDRDLFRIGIQALEMWLEPFLDVKSVRWPVLKS